MEENVTVKLCDLHSSESSNIYFSILKKKLREPSEIVFSLKWEPLHEIPKIKIIDDSSHISMYDVEIVHDRDLLIFGANSNLNFFNLTTRTPKITVQLPNDIHEIVVDGKYLYLTSGARLMKYNLTSLLHGIPAERTLVWETPSNLLSNCWGLALYQMNSKKYAFVMDYGEGILVFDTETGQQVEINVPKIKLGYGIMFTDENEMIISTSDKSAGPVQIYTFNNETQSWDKSREAVRTTTHNTPYGICYERKTKLIYLADTFARRVFVFNKHTMDAVQEWEVLNEWKDQTFYGVSLDSKNGHIYLPVVDHSIQILK